MMKKSKLVLALAAFFMFFAIAACDSKKSKKDRDEDDTEEVADEEETDEDEDDADEKDDYLTQDLATFDLRGEVIAVKYTADEHMEPVTVQFEEDGTLKSIYKFDTEGSVDEGTIDRDRKGRIETITFETLSPWVTNLTYDNSSMLPKSDTDTNQMGNYVTRTYKRDDDGNIVKTEFEEAVHGGIVEDDEEYTVKFSNYDEHGNWRRVTFKHGSYTTFLKRTIVYKGESNPYQTEIDEALEGDPVIQDFIRDMYENARYEDKDFLEEHCTERLLQYLREQYEYDGEGYAFWLFRTSSQDGKPGAENVRNQIISIAKNNEGWYLYQFFDGGWRGENKIKAYVEDGKVMIDQIERIYDEAEEAYNH